MSRRSSGWSSGRSRRAPRAGAGRHHRRVADAQPRGAQAGGGARASRSPRGRVPVIAGAGSNSTEEAIEPDAPRQAGRRRRGAGRSRPTTTSPRQAASTATSRPSPRRWTCRSSSTTSPAASVDRHDARDDGAARQAAEHRRRQGRHRQRRPRSSRPAHAPAARTSSSSPATTPRALGFNAHGGRGCISVTSNVAPRLCAEFQEACSPATMPRRLRSRTADAAAQGAVLRAKPGADQICRCRCSALCDEEVPPADRAGRRATGARRCGRPCAHAGCCSTADHGQEAETIDQQDRRREPQGARSTILRRSRRASC